MTAMSCGWMTGWLPRVSSILIVSRICTDDGGVGERPRVTPPRVALKSPWDLPPLLPDCAPPISFSTSREPRVDDPGPGGVQFSPGCAFVLVIPFTPLTSSLKSVDERASPELGS